MNLWINQLYYLPRTYSGTWPDHSSSMMCCSDNSSGGGVLHSEKSSRSNRGHIVLTWHAHFTGFHRYTLPQVKVRIRFRLTHVVSGGVSRTEVGVSCLKESAFCLHSFLWKGTRDWLVCHVAIPERTKNQVYSPGQRWLRHHWDYS